MEDHAIEVLMVEDNATDAELTLRALQGKGLCNAVHVVGDGAEALDFIFCRGAYADRKSQNGPKLILLDLRLPKVDGIEVLRQVRENERTRKTPVVVLTSSRQDPDIRTCYGLGANSYIVKPVDFDKFADAVAEIGLYWILLNEPPQ